MKPRIAAIIHEYDRLEARRLFMRPKPKCLLGDMFASLRKRGYIANVLATASAHDDADIAILHVDTTRTPLEYSDLARRFKLCLNVKVTDISKSLISEALMTRTDDWRGPVIVKTDLNYRGLSEAKKNKRAKALGRPPPFPDVAWAKAYETYPSIDQVPAWVWADTTLVVDRFLAERVPDGFAMCHYVFCGEYEFCARFVGPHQLVKAKDCFRVEEFPVPQHIRDRRSDLGFDFGKFDFVHYEDKDYLIDANRTPGRIPASGGASVEGMVDGFLSLITK
ncbi:MAG: hypothetical protein ABIO40_10945 [Devosia sp.]